MINYMLGISATISLLDNTVVHILSVHVLTIVA